MLLSESLFALWGRRELNSSTFITLEPKPRRETGEKGVRLDESSTFQYRSESGWLFVHVVLTMNTIRSSCGCRMRPAALRYSLLSRMITTDQQWCMRMIRRQEKLFHSHVLINNSCRRKQILYSCWDPLICGKWFDAYAPKSMKSFGHDESLAVAPAPFSFKRH